MSWALSGHDAEEVQQLRSALKQPGLLQAEVEEQAYALVLQQLQDIQKCNKQMSASTIKHAATRTYKDKRRAHLIKALHITAVPQQQQQQQQQQHLEGYMTQTLQRELIDKAASLAADSAAQQQEQQRLRAVLDAYEQLRLVRSQELALNTTAAEEEVALVFDFLEKMACQMSEAESELTALLQELHAQTHAAQDMLATEQQRP
ncbi:hypothetical protein OEZ86_012706 [Tetradesmus obliquus]|nr:hypothetical protein OEZ86_012706 [Tetradesmus obliquus]